LRTLIAMTVLFVTIPVSVWSAETPALTLFTFTVRSAPDERFVAATDDPGLIQRCREQLALPVEDRHLHLNGRLGAGHGGTNLSWSWHIDPERWDLVEDSIELCDGRPSFVEADLDTWLGTVGQFCPWSSFVVAEGAPYPLSDPQRVLVDLEAVVSGFDRPVAVSGAGDGSGRLFVAEQGGRIVVVEDDELRTTVFLDLADRVLSTGSEQGLLGLAFHPAFQTTGWVFVNYTDLGGDTVVSRYTVLEDDPARADPASEEVLLTIPQPFSNHNGGHLAFGPNGRLWIGTGDGGSGGDPLGNAQNPRSLLGKMLRLDVDVESGYSIPPDNPFVNDPRTRDEIWSLGLRNPWRYSFDRKTGDLYIADVGQNTWEEVDFEGAADPGGRNYGWNIVEGRQCFLDPDCLSDGLIPPAAIYDHGEGCSITGGHVYRGEVFPALAGLYLFADFCSGRIWALAPGSRHGWSVAEVGQTNVAITGFGEGDDGELWATGLGGSLYRVTARRSTPAPRRSAGRVGPSQR